MSTRVKVLARTLSAVLALLLPSTLFPQSYPIKLEKTISFESLSIALSRLTIHVGKGALALIECEKGVTGAVIIGKGTFSYATKDTQSISDTFANAMLRFNPSDYAAFIAPVGGQTGSQAGTIDQAMSVLQRFFRRLYHSGNDALIPEAGLLAGVLLADKLGDIIVLEGGQKPAVYSLNEHRALFDGGEAAPVPTFQSISKNWMPRVNRLRMDGIWQKEGVAASGDNYFYLPAPTSGKGYSQRFDPSSIYFQAWFGAYVVKDNDAGRYGFTGGKLNAKAILDLSITDQRAWLRNFAGLEKPFVSADTSTPITAIKATVAGLEGWKISARLHSNVDVGEKNPQAGRPEFLLVPASAWKEPSLEGRAEFTPTQLSGSRPYPFVDSYARAVLDVVAYVLYNTESKESYVIYYNGVDFIDKKGQRHRTLPGIQSEMEAMVSSFKVPKK